MDLEQHFLKATLLIVQILRFLDHLLRLIRAGFDCVHSLLDCLNARVLGEIWAI